MQTLVVVNEDESVRAVAVRAQWAWLGRGRVGRRSAGRRRRGCGREVGVLVRERVGRSGGAVRGRSICSDLRALLLRATEINLRSARLRISAGGPDPHACCFHAPAS